MKQFGRRALQRAGIDRAIAYSVLGRGWNVLAGVGTVFFLARFLTATEQGFYYTFSSILGLQVFFELGLSFVILQFASHEKAHLTWSDCGTLDGADEARLRLASLLRLALKWYGIASCLMLGVIVPAGWVFFSVDSANSGGVEWGLPWVLLGVVAALSLLVSPLYAIIEGCGRVASIALIRTFQGLFTSFAIWLALALHWGLYAAGAGSAAALLVGLGWLATRYRRLLLGLLATPRDEKAGRLDWRQEVWPFQWRIAVSWLSGYFIFNLFVPVLFAYQGAVVAGQMGMSISIATAISAMAISWLSTKSPTFGVMVAHREYEELDTLFSRTLKQSLVAASALSLAAVGLVAGLGVMHLPLSGRMLPPSMLAVLLASTVVNTIVLGEATYLRAHKREPFMWLSMAVGLCVAVSTVVLGRAFGAPGMLLGYLAINVLAGAGGGTWIFLRKRREWHA